MRSQPRPSSPDDSRCLANDDTGVSVVIGAVLMLGLVVISLAVVEFSFVPVWEEDAEAEHQQKLRNQVLDLQAASSQQVANGTAAEQVLPLRLGDERSSRWITMDDLHGEASFEPDTTQVTVAAPDLLLQERDGRSIVAVNEEWNSITSGGELEGIEELLHLRMRIIDPASGNDGDHVTLTLLDSDGEFAGSIRVYIDTFPSGYAIKTEVQDALGTVVVDEGESRFQQDQPPYYWVNALEEEYLFQPIFQAASKPATLVMSTEGIQGEFSALYLGDEGGFTVLIGGGGQIIPDFSTTVAGGRLAVTAQSQHLAPQSLVLEAGAVWVEQEGASAVIAAPAIDVRVAGTRTLVDIALPMYEGNNGALQSGGSVRVGLEPRASESIAGRAANLYLNVTTPQAQAWADAMAAELAMAGLVEGPHYALGVAGDDVSLLLLGLDGTSERDLQIHFTTTTIDLRLIP